MDLDTAADELYAISPDEFTERRQQLVAAAKQEKNRELATQIGKLRRPTRSAWLINLLARADPDNIAALLELGAALKEAQQRMASDELRQLSGERRKTVDAMARRAVDLGRQQGYEAPDGALQEVSQTLQTALGDPEIADLVRAGRLTQAVTYGGFGPTDLAAALGASLPSTAPSRPKEPAEAPAQPAPATRDAKQRRKAEKTAAEARERANAARQAADEAEEAAEAATQRADDLADQVESLRTQLRQTEAGEREARDAARASRKHYQELRQAALAAEQAAAAAEKALEE